MRATERAIGVGVTVPEAQLSDHDHGGRPGRGNGRPPSGGEDGTFALGLDPPPVVTPTGLARVRLLPAALVALLRPGQWAKNVLVVPVALLGAPALTTGALARVALAVVAFTLASAVVYVVNDVVDRERDRRHPVKRTRPVASGVVPVPMAWLVTAVLCALLLAVVAGAPAMFWPIGVYLGLNVAYSLWLKQVPLVDVFTLAAGFVLRALQGYTATGFPASGWLLTCVFAICLVLGLGKRRHELTVAGAGTEHRPALRGYTVSLIDHLILVDAAVAVTTYLLFLDTDTALTRHGEVAALASAPFALFAIARYLQLLLVHRQGGNPTRLLLRDRVMVVNALVWAMLVGGSLIALR